MQIAVCVNSHRLFTSQFKPHVGSLPRIQIADLPAVLSLKSFFRRIATIFKQQTHKKVLFRQFRAYLLINSFEKHQYVLLCDTNTSDFLHFSQTAFFTIHRNKLNAVGV